MFSCLKPILGKPSQHSTKLGKQISNFNLYLVYIHVHLFCFYRKYLVESTEEASLAYNKAVILSTYSTIYVFAQIMFLSMLLISFMCWSWRWQLKYEIDEQTNCVFYVASLTNTSLFGNDILMMFHPLRILLFFFSILIGE